VLVVSAGIPLPVIKEESCSQTASDEVKAMTRDWPLSVGPDGRCVTVCSYALR
jgi:hypothetical protein